MHFEANVLQGKIRSKRRLIREAKEELNETKKGRALKKAIENKKEGKKYKHIKGHEGQNLV
jgi:hypothetical protein